MPIIVFPFCKFKVDGQVLQAWILQKTKHLGGQAAEAQQQPGCLLRA